MPILGPEKRIVALACRDNGVGNRAHRVDDLSTRDMKRLLRVLTTNLYDFCDHCRYWRCKHGDKCTEYYIRALPDHLRSHVGVLSRTILRHHAPTYRADIGELCPTHVKLRPELMWDILGIFIESEYVVAAIVAQLANIPGGLFTNSRHIDKLAPLKIAAEASLMWTRGSMGTAGQEWKKKYPGARRRSQWARQRDNCAACMLARTLESPELLNTVLLSIYIRNGVDEWTGDTPGYTASDLDWIRCCLEQVPIAKEMQVTTQVATLHAWIHERLLETRQTRIVRYPQLSLNWDAYAKLVYLAQQAEMAKLHPEFSKGSTARADLDKIHRQSVSTTCTQLVGQMTTSDSLETSPTLSSHFCILPAKIPDLQLPAVCKPLPQDQDVFPPSMYSPLGLEAPLPHSRLSVDAVLDFSSSYQLITDGNTTDVAHDTSPAIQSTIPPRYHLPFSASHITGQGNLISASVCGDADNSPLGDNGRGTVFLDDDALNGQLTSRRRGDMKKLGGESDTLPSLDESRCIGDGKQPLPSKGKTESQVMGFQVSSADFFTLPTSQLDGLDYCGISELGRRIDSLSGKIKDDILAGSPAYI